MILKLALSLLIASEASQTVKGFAFPSWQRASNVIITHNTAFIRAQSHIAVQTSPQSRLILRGILDEIESDSYNLLSSTEENQVNMNDAYEVFLGDLVFSTNDPRMDIVENFDLATDPKFLTWLENKIEKSRDPDERLALKDLMDMIEDVTTKVKVSRLAEERAAAQAEQTEEERRAELEAEAETGRKMTNTDVLKKAAAIDAKLSGVGDVGQAKVEKKSFYEQEITPEIRLSYDKTLKQVLPPYKPGETVDSIVSVFYDQFDAQFVKVLNERVNNGDNDARAVLEALAVEQQKRISQATETLKSVLSLGDPMRMEGAVVKLAREGKIDEPFLLLLEANATQARDAGANGPAQLMGMFITCLSLCAF